MSIDTTASLDQFADAYTEEFAYSFDNNLILRWYPRRIIAKSPPGKLLELGIGHGYSTKIFNEHFERHLIIDASPKIIEQFRQNFPELDVEIVESYFETFELDEKFDVISMGFVLEHVDEPVAILRKFRDHLAPAGRIFITVPNAESLHRRIGHAAGLLDDIFSLGEGDRQLGHKQLFSVSTLTEQVEQCGYELVAIEGLFLKPFTTSQIRSLELSPDILQGMMKIGVTYPELCCALLAEARLPA